MASPANPTDPRKDDNGFGLEHLDLQVLTVAPEALALISVETCRELDVVPVELFDQVLTLAIPNLEVLMQLRPEHFTFSVQIEPVRASRESIRLTIERLYGHP
ncbi:MAG: hypothetical protein AMXMBFR7_30440 [Planctomycetota bacterium]